MRPLRLALIAVFFAPIAPLACHDGHGAQTRAAESRQSAPKRVVSLLPAFTEVVDALGCQNRLVGSTEHCQPEGDPERVPWQGAAAAETILRLSPDLVLRQSRREGDDPLLDALSRAGVRVLVLPSETVEEARAAIPAIGAALGEVERAEALAARFDRELVEAARFAERTAKGARPRVLFVFGRAAGAASNLSVAGPGCFLDELIRLAGGVNAMEGFRQPYPTPRLEEVVRAAPDVIVDNMPPESTPKEVRAAWAQLQEVPAVRNGRVHALFEPDLLIPGPDLPAAVRRLAELIHG